MSTPPRRCPYVGLVPYSEDDWPFFFGREAETELIIANLTASRLTLLFGASGVGKSSVLRAGVGHHLAEQARGSRATRGAPEVAFVVFSQWSDDPMTRLVPAVREAVARATGREPPLPARPGRLADTFAAWAEQVGGELLIVLDQFEEYFLYHATEDGAGTFAVEFPELLKAPGLRTNFLVSIREDAVARLDRFKGRIPNLFDNYLRLEHLTVEAAEDSVRRPLAAFNAANPGDTMQMEDALADEVLRQTRRGTLAAGRAGGVLEAPEAGAPRIETPYLQMVLTRLWEEESRRGSRTLRADTFTAPPPAGLGGADQIVRTHLDHEMAKLAPAERDIAAQAFRFLVTRTGTKIALAVEDIAGYSSLADTALAPVLDKLAAGERRILRRVPVLDRPDAVRYEIFHDVLGPAITDWRRRHEALKEQDAIRRQEEQQRFAELEAADERRKRDRARYLKFGLVSLSLAIVVLCGALFVAVSQYRLANRRAEEASASEKEARAALERAEAASRSAIEARGKISSLAETPAASARGEELRQAFLQADTAVVEETARRLGLLNEQARYRAQRVEQGPRGEQGQSYEFSLEPVASSIPGGLAALAAVTFKMDHATFRNKLLGGDRNRGFRASYFGWGCLAKVAVLLEYADPRRSPELGMFPMCASLETAAVSVFLHIPSESQRERAQQLGAQIHDQLHYRFEGTQNIEGKATPPSLTTEVRYFNVDDEGAATRIVAVLRSGGVADPVLKRVTVVKAKPGTVEVWFPSKPLEPREPPPNK